MERRFSFPPPLLLRFRLDRHYMAIADPPIEILTAEPPVTP
jgi:hypothetical protein